MKKFIIIILFLSACFIISDTRAEDQRREILLYGDTLSNIRKKIYDPGQECTPEKPDKENRSEKIFCSNLKEVLLKAVFFDYGIYKKAYKYLAGGSFHIRNCTYKAYTCNPNSPGSGIRDSKVITDFDVAFGGEALLDPRQKFGKDITFRLLEYRTCHSESCNFIYDFKVIENNDIQR